MVDFARAGLDLLCNEDAAEAGSAVKGNMCIRRSLTSWKLCIQNELKFATRFTILTEYFHIGVWYMVLGLGTELNGPDALYSRFDSV